MEAARLGTREDGVGIPDILVRPPISVIIRLALVLSQSSFHRFQDAFGCKKAGFLSLRQETLPITVVRCHQLKGAS